MHSPPGKIVYSKWYRNSEHATFEDVFKTFLKEAGENGAAVKVRSKRVGYAGGGKTLTH